MSQIVKDMIPAPAGSAPLHRPHKRDLTKRRIPGILLRINQEKGYGFIRPDTGGAEYYVHVGSMIDRESWVEGTEVTFVPGGALPGSRKAPPAFSVRAKKKGV